MSVSSKRIPSNRVAEAAAAVAGRYTQTGTITVGYGPSDVAITANGLLAYVANYFDESVSVVDTSAQAEIATIKLGEHPFGIAVTPDGASVYVGLGVSVPGKVAVIDTATRQVTKTITIGEGACNGIAMTADGAKVYVTTLKLNAISVIDTASQAEDAQGHLSLGPNEYMPWGLTVTTDGKTLYTTAYASNLLVAIDTASGDVTNSIDVGGAPQGVAITSDARHGFVTNLDDNTVSAIDIANGIVTATIGVSPFPNNIAMAPDDLHVFLPNIYDGTVSVLDTTTNSIAYSVTVGTGPKGIAVAPDGNHVYVTNYGHPDVADYGNTISVLERVIAPSFTSSDATDGQAGVALTFPITVAGNPAPTLSTPTLPDMQTIPGPDRLPKGLTLNTDTIPYGVTGTIVPDAQPGAYSFGLQATNGVEPDAFQMLTITVAAAAIAPAFTSSNSTDATAGQAFTFPITVTGEPAPTVSTTTPPEEETAPGADRLPMGLTVHTETDPYEVAGTVHPTVQSGDYSFGLHAANGVDPDAFQTLTITVAATLTPLAFTSPDSTKGQAGRSLTFPITVTGDPAPTLSTTTPPTQETRPGPDRLPKGLTLNTATAPFGITGTIDPAVQPGDYLLGLYAENGVSAEVFQTLTITVAAAAVAPTFTSRKAKEGTTGEAFTFPITVTGNPAPVLSTTTPPTQETRPGADRLPKGLTLKLASSWEVSGTIDPSVQQGSYFVGLHAANGVSPDAFQTLTIVVSAPARAL